MFTLKIKLGNDAMLTPEDVAEALQRVARTIVMDVDNQGNIRDLNGNTVGEWRYKP
jgi:hypothetical protein